MDAVKKAFIEAWPKTFGNVTDTCSAVNISRTTYYTWIKEDNEFKSAIENINAEEMLLDLVENKLIKKVKEDDITALIFIAKTKGKKRGYNERQEIQHSGFIANKYVYESDQANEPIGEGSQD